MTTDDDVGLQPERTGLAWTRTMVSLAIVIGLLGAHAYHHGRLAPVLVLAVGAAFALVVLSSPVAHWRMRQARRHMAQGVSPLSGGLLLLVSAVVVVASLAGLLVVAWTA